MSNYAFSPKVSKNSAATGSVKSCNLGKSSTLTKTLPSTSFSLSLKNYERISSSFIVILLVVEFGSPGFFKLPFLIAFVAWVSINREEKYMSMLGMFSSKMYFKISAMSFEWWWVGKNPKSLKVHLCALHRLILLKYAKKSCQRCFGRTEWQALRDLSSSRGLNRWISPSIHRVAPRTAGKFANLELCWGTTF